MKSVTGIPPASRALPVLGHVVPLLRDPLAFLTSLPAHGDLVHIRLGPFPMIVICDPELTHQALLADGVFDKGGPLFDRAREVVGDGLASCPHSAHRRLRRLAQPAFHPARLPGYAQIITSSVEEVTGSWSAGQILDVPAEMTRITSQVAASALFSGSLPPDEVGQLQDDIRTIVGGFLQRMFLIPPLDRLPLPRNRSFERARARLRHTCEQVIAQRRADGTDHGDLLSALIAAHDPEYGDRGMTDAEISDTVNTFFVGAIETTASLLAWTLDLVSGHPQIERRLHDEIDAVLDGAPPVHADIPRLPLTGHVLTEALRLRPPGWFITRTVTEDTRLGGHLLPAGTTVVYSPYIIHHRPDLYDQPETYDPDRWNPDRPQPPRNALIPFAAGARKCIGDTFAMTEATLTLASTMARWRLEHLPGHQTRPALSAALRPRELRMRAIPR